MTGLAPWLLVGLLAFAAGFVVRDVFEVVRKTGRHASTLDLTPAAARGELLHLDWSDQRGTANGTNIQVTSAIEGPIIAEGGRVPAAVSERHLAAMKDGRG